MQESILRRLVLITFLMSIVGYSEKSSGYEFSMTGIMTWKYASYSQLGSNGFFGPFDTDASDAGGAYGGSKGSAASMNGWLGHEMQSMPTGSDWLLRTSILSPGTATTPATRDYGEISSGSDLALATFYMTICPELRLTQALRIRGSYRIGSWETPYAPNSRGSMVRSEYPEGMAPGVQRSFSPGYWETLWASLQTPWGIVVFGKRPGPFGLGVMFDGNDNADAVGIMLMTNYGPFRVGINVAPWLLGSPYYYTLSDKNAVRQFDLGAGMTYDSGPISSGLGGRVWKFHTGPESATFQDFEDPTTHVHSGRAWVIPTDTVITDGTVYFKYFNGRFFFNAEAAWGYEITKRQRWLASDSGVSEGKSRFAPNYVEHWRTAVETGALIGPSRISSIWSYIPGFDRRHGVRIDRQQYPPMNIATALTNVSMFRPYSLLLSYTYGSGNNSITPDSRHGYMTDANIFGMRLDYAIAANLNIFGTAFTAKRISHGYGQGYIRPQYSTTVTPNRFTGKVQFVETDNFNNPAPSIPDNSLGYEFDWGFGWKLMDKYTLNATFGVWKPGGWFSYACVDRSVSNWKSPDVSNNFGVGPGKSIDPVFGMEIKIDVEY